MKSIYLILVVLGLTAFRQAPKITLEAPDYAGDTCELSYYNCIDSIVLDNRGRAEIGIKPTMNFVYINLKGKVRTKLYTGQNNLKISVGPNNVVTFEGKCADESRYLSKVRYPQLNWFKLEKSTPEQFSEYLQSHLDTLNTILSRASLKDPSFVKFQRDEFEFSNEMFRVVYLLKKRQLDDTQIKEFQKKFCENETLLPVSSYVFAMYRFPVDMLLYQYKGKVRLPYEEMREVLSFYQKQYKSPKIREAVIHMLAKEYISEHGNDPQLDRVYRANVTDPVMLKEYQNLSQKWKSLTTEKPCLPVPATNLKGEPLNFDQYKGKYIILDIWATWCKPCKEEQRVMLAFEPEFKGKDVVFITLSCDKDRKRWEDYCKKNNMVEDFHFNVTNNSVYLKQYAIRVIPRFILIDPNGNLLSANYFYPSHNSFKTVLYQFLGER